MRRETSRASAFASTTLRWTAPSTGSDGIFDIKQSLGIVFFTVAIDAFVTPNKAPIYLILAWCRRSPASLQPAVLSPADGCLEVTAGKGLQRERCSSAETFQTCPNRWPPPAQRADQATDHRGLPVVAAGESGLADADGCPHRPARWLLLDIGVRTVSRYRHVSRCRHHL